MNGRKITITQKTAILLMLFITPLAYGNNKDIEGDWQLILTGLGRSFPLRISIQPDGTLTATSQGIPLNKITFDGVKLHFEGGSPLCIFEGTIKEDGLTIEGELQQEDQQWSALLQRVERVSPKTAGQDDGETGQARDQKLQDRNKLVAWWKLDEADGNDIADSSGNGYTGTLFGNPQWQPTGGKVGGALVFDGVGDFVEIEDEPAFDLTGSITIAAWIKVNSFDKRWQAIVTKGDTAWRIQRTLTEDTLAFKCTGITSTGSRHGIEGKKSVNDGKWHHVVGVYDGSIVSLYIDGVLDKSCEASGNIQMNDAPVFIGANSEVSNREWNGVIDEVCIIAGAIDANAVDAFYKGADPVMIAQTAKWQLQGRDRLLAWWRFENDANDSAGSNHGSIHGNPAYVAGKLGQAIRLDDDDYVDCGNADVLNFGTGDWTLTAWIKTTQTGTNESDELMNRGTIFANGGDQTDGIRVALVLNEARLDTITLTTDDNINNKVQATGSTRVNDGAWHHVVGMRNVNQLHLYIDGTLEGRSLLYNNYDLSGVSQHNAYIGAITDNTDNSLIKHFVGMIDEVCVFTCALDADSIGALYSGKDPTIVAEQAKAVTPQQPQQAGPVAKDMDITGDWKGTFATSGRSIVIKIRKKADSTLTATLTADETTIPVSKVDFTNGKLHLEAISIQTIIEGTMAEDGETIECQLQQTGQQMKAFALKRIEQAKPEVEGRSDSNTATGLPDQPLATQSDGGGSLVTTLVLIFILVGMIGGIVLFMMKSSIRR